MNSYGYCAATLAIQTALGAIAGGAFYAIWLFSSSMFSLELPLWLAAVSATTVPVAFAGAVAASLASVVPRRGRAPVLGLVCVAGMVASVSVYQLYMAELVPAINWTRGWLLPAASFFVSFILGSLRWPVLAGHSTPARS